MQRRAMKLWIAAVTATVSPLACAPALKTPAEIIDFARQPGAGDIEKLFDALRSPIAAMRSHAAWALGFVSFAAIPGQIALGHISDRIGREWVWTVCNAGSVLC